MKDAEEYGERECRGWGAMATARSGRSDERRRRRDMLIWVYVGCFWLLCRGLVGRELRREFFSRKLGWRRGFCRAQSLSDKRGVRGNSGECRGLVFSGHAFQTDPYSTIVDPYCICPVLGYRTIPFLPTPSCLALKVVHLTTFCAAHVQGTSFHLIQMTAFYPK
ncbi:hypothetical protein VTK26DRAFT_2710 [Humicola hyalothermophila]